MNHPYLESKSRYEILDGLRGVAAMVVVAFHMFECYSPGPLEQIINHGYLAVDFFFALSGFVIAYAYDDRWDRMTLWEFFKRRIVRLHPMAVFGTLLCACFFYLGTTTTFTKIADTSWQMFLLMILWCCTLIPVPPSCDIRGWNATNPINDPTWTLQFEYLANIVYALVIRRFSKLLLVISCLIAAFFTVTLTMNIDLFGLLEPRSYAAYTVIGGWIFDPTHIFIGLVRLACPFLTGILLARIGRFIKIPHGFIWCSMLILAITLMPRLGGSEHMWLNGLYEAFAIIVLFPVILSIGAGSKISNRRIQGICNFLGHISYPLYITHIAFIYMLYTFRDSHPDASLGTIICVCAGLYIAALCTAYASLKLYDIPLREWLKRHWLHKPFTPRNPDKPSNA